MEKNPAAPVVVLGTTFVDLKCFPSNELNFKGRNQGVTRFYHGGVGRNVAETIALLGSEVRFVSSVQQDGVGREVISRLERHGVDLTGLLRVDEPGGHGLWVAILHKDGDLACSLSQLPHYKFMKEAWRQSGRQVLSGAKWCVLEIDSSVSLPEQVTQDAQELGVKLIGLPGNFVAIRKKPSILEGLHTWICNQNEAEELADQAITSLPEATEALKKIQSRWGIRQVVVTLGALGSVYADFETGEHGHVPVQLVHAVDTTGAGDSFVAGCSHALVQGAPLGLAVEAATRVAAWTVSSEEAVCLDLQGRIRNDPWDGWKQIGAKVAGVSNTFA
ncbi:MAG TPA: PfkB family carbohydrate kinase [Symbiobacteriaceae bacterium]|nr:PfkB family carbohydrate kinase [Symbiobacteriaceae bacterium]